MIIQKISSSSSVLVLCQIHMGNIKKKHGTHTKSVGLSPKEVQE
jgi:hypothetical protein